MMISPDKKPVNILIVEDDYAMMRGLKDNFSTAGYNVQSAMDGQQGLDLALEGQSDLILLDIMLPKINGYAICESVRQAGLDMPIIMLTAKGQEEDIVRGLSLGADDYVTKPFSIKELKARVVAFLRRHAQNEIEEVLFGECRYNVPARTLFRFENIIALAPKELGVLELFIRRQGHVLTRDTILNAVWAHDFMSSSRSVDRCISTLRKKIEIDVRHPKHIISLRDIGYRFEL